MNFFLLYYKKLYSSLLFILFPYFYVNYIYLELRHIKKICPFNNFLEKHILLNFEKTYFLILLVF